MIWLHGSLGGRSISDQDELHRKPGQTCLSTGAAKVQAQGASSPAPDLHEFAFGLGEGGKALGELFDNTNSGEASAAGIPSSDDGKACHGQPCSACIDGDADKPARQRVSEMLDHCQTLREFVDGSTNWVDTSHTAAIMMTRDGRVLDYDYRGSTLLKSGNVLRLVAGDLRCVDEKLNKRFLAAVRLTAKSGRPSNLLLCVPSQLDRRYSLSLVRMRGGKPAANDDTANERGDILCLVAPLDRRRLATARQLMDLFGLSAAEARLARAISNGASAEDYAADYGLRLPTVRSQLRAIFHKTDTDRQVDLVRLVGSIPVVRECV